MGISKVWRAGRGPRLINNYEVYRLPKRATLPRSKDNLRDDDTTSTGGYVVYLCITFLRPPRRHFLTIKLHQLGSFRIVDPTA